MSEVDRYFHEVWLGMVQPIDGLVVSIPVLVDAQCMERQPPHVQQKLLALCDEHFAIPDLVRFLSDLLGLTPDLFDAGDAIPEEVSLYVPEGKQTIRPTMALKKQGGVAGYEMLVWDVPAGLDLDKPETVTGTWDYPPSAKFDRLLRHCRVPIGLLTNRHVNRLIYAPHGESSGGITFRIDDMASVGGRPILDAFVMLLSANRFFGVSLERALPALLAESRTRQANVTNELADQVFEALQILLRGFEVAAERDGGHLLDDALEREGDHLYKGLLTVMLRLVFLLYAEDRALLPVEQPVYANHLSVLALFEELQADRGAYPDSMSRRFGAWGRLIALFRAVFLGCTHGVLQMPPRRGALFNPHEYPFLEGWGPGGGAPITLPESRAEVRLPTIDDETIFRVLQKLLVLDGQRLSYRALDVEQIGSVYEALMGYHVQRVPADSVCLRPNRLWLNADEVLEVPAASRARWLKETIGISGVQATKLNEELKPADAPAALELLSKYAAGRHADPSLSKAKKGQLVLQPGAERRRTSSHYTPRSLSAPIVRQTLEPLLAAVGNPPKSERILNLKVCDPAMGSGAFLVEACRFLADALLAAWTREGKVEDIAKNNGDPLLHARRLVAQRCLYGVDKNDAAVELARLSLWLVTLSKSLPFTFLDHCLRHGDSIVGLDFDQIRNFHWKVPHKKRSNQLELFGREIEVALDDAIQLRQTIGELGDSVNEDREKARLFWDAQDAVDRIRLIGDLAIGAFFAHDNDKDREAERVRREALVRDWLLSNNPPSGELLGLQQELRAKLPVFHWMVEFPEVFYAERPDPLDENQVNRAAFMDAFMGNPPFLGGTRISVFHGVPYRHWLTDRYDASGNSDLVAFFVRRCAELLGQKGTMGLIGTNTIAQGDTRLTGLSWVCLNGGKIYAADASMPWPGEAGVAVSIVCIALGLPTPTPVLDGQLVPRITSFLASRGEEHPPATLISNRGVSVRGSMVMGIGFVFDDGNSDATPLSVMRDITKRNPRNEERIWRYVGGEDLNTDPRQTSNRYVIDFGELDQREARNYPELFAIVEAKVKPARASVGQRDRREEWWRHANRSPLFRAHVSQHGRALAASTVSSHLAFAFVSADVVVSHRCVILLISSDCGFAIVQSRIHECWASFFSSSLKEDLSYTPTECFETFPFPKPDPRTVISTLEDVGRRLYEFRANYMIDENVGLTATYKRLKDPACDDARIITLRNIHEETDRAVLDAYGWSDISVPPFCVMNGKEMRKAKFENEIIDRLFALNVKRAEEERIKGLAMTGTTKKARKPKLVATPTKKTLAPKDSDQ